MQCCSGIVASVGWHSSLSAGSLRVLLCVVQWCSIGVVLKGKSLIFNRVHWTARCRPGEEASPMVT